MKSLFLFLLIFTLVLVSSSALATPFKFTFTTTVLSDGTPGVADGGLLTLDVIVDNGNATLVSQSWYDLDVLSAVATVGTYVAEFIYPHFNDLTFQSNAEGNLSLTSFYDLDGNNLDNLGTGSPTFWGNTLVTSQGNMLDFLSSHPLSSSSWSVSMAASEPVPEPSTFLLFGSGLLGVAWYGRKRKKA